MYAFTNKTDIPSPFLRRLTRWVIKRTKANPGRWLHSVRFGSVKNRPTEAVLKFTTKSDAMVIVVYVQKGEPSELRHRVYSIILQLGKVMPRFGGPKVPTGDLGIIRQQVGFDFLNDAENLIKQWTGKPPAPGKSRQQVKLERAHAAVAKWQSKAKLANTKLKIWNRRLAAAQHATAIQERLSHVEIIDDTNTNGVTVETDSAV